MSQAEARGASPRIHQVGDLLAIVVFVALGMAEHRAVADLGAAARNMVIFCGMWILFGWATGLYRAPAGTKPVSLALVGSWLGSVGGGVLVRAILLGRTGVRGQVVFFLVAAAFTGVLLLGWRLAYLGLRAALAHASEGGAGRSTEGEGAQREEAPV